MAYTVLTVPNINCGHCKYFGNDCKRVDHDRVKFYKPSFASYNDGEHHFPCHDFEPRNPKWADYKDWEGIDDAWPVYLKAWRNGKEPKATMFHVHDNYDVAYVVPFELFFYGGMIEDGVLKANEKKFYERGDIRLGVQLYRLVEEKINGVMLRDGEEI